MRLRRTVGFMHPPFACMGPVRSLCAFWSRKGDNLGCTIALSSASAPLHERSVSRPDEDGFSLSTRTQPGSRAAALNSLVLFQ